ncbi:response regulator transcription factor [Vibrio profundi]|uniref:response regulator transcription factor n=1 Tax=Vibrio profundi TaxID=1774960 RepID=UPI003735953B
MLFSTAHTFAHSNTTNHSAHGSLLVVEDDIALNEQLTDLLSNQGYQVTNCTCGQDALDMLKAKHFDLILLDVDVPNIDGFSLLNFIHTNHKAPVIMLTAYGAEEHRIRGFQSGADDYISKPCSFTEISLRIEAVLRRTRSHFQSPIVNHASVAEYKELTLNKSEHTVIVQTHEKQPEIHLTPIQFKLLWVLIQNAGSIQSKPYLYQAVLERDFSQYDRSLDMHLSRIRKRLISEGMANERIQTVHGKGYIVK